MGDNFDKRLEKLIADNTSGSHAIAAEAAGLFKGAISGGWYSSTDLADRLRDACARLRKSHPNLVTVQKLCEALESELAAEQQINKNRVLELLDQWRDEHFAAAIASMADHLVPLLKPGCRILSHSQSSTVLGVLKHALVELNQFQVEQTVGYPMKEGVLMARELAVAGIQVRLINDAGAAAAVGACDLVLLGADSIHRGGVVNKLGSLGISLAARHFGVPVYAVADSSKLVAGESMPVIEKRNPVELSDLKHPRIEVNNVYFEIIPLDLFKAIITEESIFSQEILSARL